MSALILKEFEKSNPCGNDFKYEDRFLLIEQEIDKNYSVTSLEHTNWELVQEKTISLLQNHTKDLKILSWWLVASWKLDSFSNLESSLSIFIKIVNTYAHDMFPKSLKAKRNSLIWLDELLTKEIISLDNKEIDILKYEKTFKSFEELQKILINILGKEDVFFGKLLRHFDLQKEKALLNLQDKSQTTSKISDEVKSKKELKSKDKSKSIEHSNKDVNISEINNKDDANKVLFLFKKHASLLNDYYKKESSFCGKALKITRMLSWLNIEGLPQSTNNITFINPPSSINLNKINDDIKNKNYEDAFFLIQKTIEKSPFWLDGHFLSYEILKETNNEYLANEVKTNLESFIKTNAGVQELFFKDETPFANKKTMEFLNSFNTESIKKEKEEEKIVQIKNTNDDFINNNNIKEAMELLQEQYDLSSSMQGKFKLRLQQSKLAIKGKEFNMALVLLDELEESIVTYNLDEWQPELASEVYILILKNFFKQSINTNRMQNAYERLCKIDISHALNINIGE